MMRAWFAAIALLAFMPVTADTTYGIDTATDSVDVMHLDAVVTDRKQRPIRDLSAGDFEISESGEPRTIESVRLQSGGKRVVAIFLDEYHVEAGDSTLRARAALTQFVDTELRADDMVAIMKPLDPLNAIDLTQDRSTIREAIQQFEGRKGDYAPRTPFEQNFMSRAPDAAERSRTQVIISALQALTIRLGDVSEARKAIVLVSEGFTAAMPNGSDRLLGGVRAIVYAANRHGVAFYPIDPCVTARDATQTNVEQNSATLKMLAEQTGGGSSVGHSDLAPTLKQVVSDLDGYYVVAYRSSKAADGKFHPIRLRVKRSDAQIRTRSGYWAALAVTRPATNVARTLSMMPARPPHSSPYIRPWIGMSRGSDGLTTVTVTWEPGATPPRNQRVTSVILKATTGDGRVLFQERIAGSQIDDRGAITTLGGRATFDAPPGHLSLEMIVQSGGTQLDTDYRGMQVPNFRVAKITFATPQLLRTRTARAFASIVANPNAAPSAAREFSRAERLLLRVPVFGPNETIPIVTATLLNRKGTPMRQLQQVSAPLPAGTVQFDLPLSWLAPDEYRVELVATAPGSPVDVAKEAIIFRVTH
jgi:VWFA-related protein